MPVSEKYDLQVIPGTVHVELVPELAFAERLLSAAEAFAAQLDVADIDLPPVVGAGPDQAHLRTIAPLYFAAELESARLLPAAELLSGLFVNGSLQVELGPGGQLIADFWRHRNQRLTSHEREAMFASLFGAASGAPLATSNGRNTAFESLMIDLTEALAKLGSDSLYARLPTAEVSVRAAASELASNLVSRSEGLAAYAGRDLVAAIRQAVKIFEEPSVQHALGARGLWGAVRNVITRYMSADLDIDSHVSRGKSGMVVLAWLADAAPFLETTGGMLISLNHPAIGAAAIWLQSSLTLAERIPSTSAAGG